MHHLLVLQALVGDDVFLALRRVEIDRQFDALRLVDAQRQVRLFLQVLQTEAFQIFLCQGLCIQDAGSCGFALLAWGAELLGSAHEGRLACLLTVSKVNLVSIFLLKIFGVRKSSDGKQLLVRSTD